MHVVVAAKQVLDPDGVNSYALWGRLAVADDRKSFNVSGQIPNIINAYDEQAMEAALRLRDAGGECRITAVSVGPASTSEVLKRCVAMGADHAIQVIDPDSEQANGFRTAAVLAALVRELGDVDLVLCGRQGSDYDQGTVPAVLAESLNAAFVTLAAGIAPANNGVRVPRVTPLGEEVVEATFPAVVTVSNEIGVPRYPTSRGMLDARRKQIEVREASALLGGDTPDSGVEIVEVFVPQVQGNCQEVIGATPEEKARALMQLLTAAGAFNA